MSSIEKSKPNVLLDEQQAQVNCLYTLCHASIRREKKIEGYNGSNFSISIAVYHSY